MSILHRILNIWQKFITMTNYYQNLDFWSKFGSLIKIWIFDQNLDFWSKFGSLIKIWMFDQNLDFLFKFWFLIKIWIMQIIFNIWTNLNIHKESPHFGKTKSFTRKNNLIRHNQHHFKSKLFKCDFCNYSHFRKDTVNAHARSKHRK